MDNTRNLIDYAVNDDAVNFRQELYAAIHDRVTAHIDAKKQEIAQGLLNTEEKAITSGKMKKEEEKFHMKKEEEEIFESGRLIEDFNMINEVSIGAKIRAYAHHVNNAWEHGDMGNDDEYEHHAAKANKIHAHILKHHGPEAAEHANKAAKAHVFGTEKSQARAGAVDSLEGGLRGMHSKTLTKKGKIPKPTQSAMKNRAKGSYGNRVVGPKGHLPEDVELDD